MFRKEKKDIINNIQKEQLKHRLSPIMDLDPILGHRKFYRIRSLYFDDYNDTSLKQVINGISERYKYRIRFYNFNTEYIVLEKKYKINNMTKKLGCIINGKINISKNNSNLLNELYLMMKTKLLKPVIIIDYDRIPYVYDAGCVRITFDYNITCSYDIKNLFDPNINRIPLMEKNNSILEVKYNDFIPDFIRYSLQINTLNRTSYSKYGNGRLTLKKINGG